MGMGKYIGGSLLVMIGDVLAIVGVVLIIGTLWEYSRGMILGGVGLIIAGVIISLFGIFIRGEKKNEYPPRY
jgi:hypothetical protein